MIRELFEDREDAGRRLAERMRGLPLTRPLVLAIPRGGVEVGAILARAFGAELDVVLSRKLRAPNQPELAIGALSESGDVHLDPGTIARSAAAKSYVEQERMCQMAEIERRARLFRVARPKAPVAGRSVIITDDGIATGSTMIAALHTVRAWGPLEIIVAVPVAPRARLAEVRPLCDRLVCLDVPNEFWAVGQFYRDFAQVSDERVLQLLGESARPDRASAAEDGGNPRRRDGWQS
jgi:predicted phosphoribosyltransferase